LTDETIDTADIPPLTESFFARAAVRQPHSMVTVTVPIDSDIWEWFRAQGQECEQRVNAALRIYVESHKVYANLVKASN
jgi:uncharacterized protein (DUF4415 family)